MTAFDWLKIGLGSAVVIFALSYAFDTYDTSNYRQQQIHKIIKREILECEQKSLSGGGRITPPNFKDCVKSSFGIKESAKPRQGLIIPPRN